MQLLGGQRGVQPLGGQRGVQPLGGKRVVNMANASSQILRVYRYETIQTINYFMRTQRNDLPITYQIIIM